MHIRSAREQDFPAIAAVTNRAIVGSAIHFAYEPVTAEELAALWCAKRDRYPWLVAEQPGERGGEARFAGYAKAGVWRDRSAYGWTVETAVYVEPWAHRRGVGRALYTALLDVLREQGYRAAVAGITLPNAASVRLHEAVGFRHVGVFPRVGWKLDRWHDVGFWEATLGESGAPAQPIRAPRLIP